MLIIASGVQVDTPKLDKNNVSAELKAKNWFVDSMKQGLEHEQYAGSKTKKRIHSKVLSMLENIQTFSVPAKFCPKVSVLCAGSSGPLVCPVCVDEDLY